MKDMVKMHDALQAHCADRASVSALPGHHHHSTYSARRSQLAKDNGLGKKVAA